MNFLNQLSGDKPKDENQTQSQSGEGLMGKINDVLGGGQSGERKEDPLDKTVDWVQEHVLGQGPQDNESAIEQAKDEQISDFIRQKYKDTTGKEFPVSDK